MAHHSSSWRTPVAIAALSVAVVACSSEPTIGSAQYAYTENNQFQQGSGYAWARPAYFSYDGEPARFGGYVITIGDSGDDFTAPCDTAAAEPGEVTGYIEEMTILTTEQVSEPDGLAQLVPGTISVVPDAALRGSTPPAASVASFAMSQPPLTQGSVTISSFGKDSIVGAITAQSERSDSPTSLGASFESIICPN